MVKAIEANLKTVTSAQAECQSQLCLEHVSRNHNYNTGSRDREVIVTASHLTYISAYRLDPACCWLFRYTHLHATQDGEPHGPAKKTQVRRRPLGVDYPNLKAERAMVIADSLLQQLIPALVYVAQGHVINRDIKPQNILFKNVKEEGGYKLYPSDFGLVKDLSLGSDHSPRRGARGFIAPEMRDPSLDPPNSGLDYWSLFVVALYVIDKEFRTEVDIFDKTKTEYISLRMVNSGL